MKEKRAKDDKKKMKSKKTKDKRKDQEDCY
jgi:hypothetical protein